MSVIPISCSFDNYSYLFICPVSGDAAVVDPTESYPILEEIRKHNVTVAAVLCTHHHSDHVGDISGLLETFPDAKVYCYHGDSDRIAHANCFAKDNEVIMVGGCNGKVIHTPGHTDGSICYRFDDVLFTGDTLFGAGCGRLFEGTAKQLYDSLMGKIASLPDDTRLYFGHEYTQKNLEFALLVEPQNNKIAQRLQALKETGNISTPTTVELEKETNPFFRCDSHDIRNNLLQRGVEVDDPEEVFAVLRQLRNSF